MTGRKPENKTYYSYSGYPGGLKAITFKKAIKSKPEWVVERAIKGMLPKNRLGRAIYKNMHVYAGASHPHEAQKPKKLEL